MYEEALARDDDDHDSLWASVPGKEFYRLSFQKALSMYKAGLLDGTKTTYICAVEVIKLASLEWMPHYTIMDSPSLAQHSPYTCSALPTGARVILKEEEEEATEKLRTCTISNTQTNTRSSKLRLFKRDTDYNKSPTPIKSPSQTNQQPH